MTAATGASMNQQVVRIGRVALATQGVLYGIVGLLAVQVAFGDRGAEASQRGAIESVARQSHGRLLLVVVVVGLAAHATWRLVLGIRGEPGDDEDSKSLAKRAANVGRSALYVSLTVAALRLLTRSGGSGGSGASGGGGGSSEQQSTSTVLSWPGGPWIVAAVGLGIIGAGAWNVRKAITRSFLDDLDLGKLPAGRRRSVELLGAIGHVARGGAFALVGWFLLAAGRQHDAEETRGLDGALLELAETDHGPLLLLALALGMVLFGGYRLVDAAVRRPSEITHA